MIVDDESSAREVLKIMIDRYNMNCNIVAEADSVASAVSEIRKHKPDLLFLDIELKNEDGFDVLEAIQNDMIPTIFVTAFNHYAIKAIKYNAFDYILKPIDYQELIVSVDNVRKSISKNYTRHSFQNYTHNKTVSKASEYKIAIQHKGERLFVSLSDIVWCQAEKSYTSLFLHSGQKLLSSKNLGEFEKIFPSDQFDDFFFYRIHHSTIVNTKYIKKYLSKKSLVQLENGEQLKISERRKSQFQKILHHIIKVM